VKFVKYYHLTSPHTINLQFIVGETEKGRFKDIYEFGYEGDNETKSWRKFDNEETGLMTLKDTNQDKKMGWEYKEITPEMLFAIIL
jgi:hypothetical protein